MLRLALVLASHKAPLKVEADHAHLVAYFATDEAKHVTGQVISVDGAQGLYMPLAAQRLQHIPSGHVGQTDIEDHEIGRKTGCGLERLGAACRARRVRQGRRLGTRRRLRGLH